MKVMMDSETQAAEVIEGQDIICFANDFDSDPLSKKHIMLRLAQKNRVLWVNSIGTRNPQASARDFRRVMEKLSQAFKGCRQSANHLFTYSPVAIPFHGNRIAQWLNQHWLAWSIRRVCRKLGFKDAISWCFLPTAANVVGNLRERMIVYHCVDEFSEFTGTSKAALLAMEQQLMEKADLVIVSSGPLYDSKRRYNANTFFVGHGVDVEHFRKACDPQTKIPAEVASLPHPVIGFHGLIADWVDLELIRYLATERPNWSFVLVGKVDTNIEMLHGLANVHLLGRKHYDDLPSYCKGFDVALLPFVVNELTLASNPLKLREYLAAGLPVVSSALPESARLGALVRTANTRSEFLEQIEDVLAHGIAGPQLTRSHGMNAESWDGKVRELSRLVTQRLRSDALPRGTATRHSSHFQEDLPGSS